MLILASASPRRKELLTQAGFQFQVHPSHIPEDLLPGEDPIAYVTRLARQKAEAVFNEMVGAPGLDFQTGESELTVLGADTTVVLDTHILAKPESAEDAARMLRLLSGRTHRVITGVSVVTGSAAGNCAEGAPARAVSTAAEVTAVQFLTISEAEIQACIATGEPMDKAGAYAIQGYAARWIPRIDGCYFNVVGLPISLVSTLLSAQGVVA